MLEKLQKLGRVATTLVRKPGALGKVLEWPDEWEYRERIQAQYGLGRGLPTIDLFDLVPGLDEHIDPYCFNNGSSRPIDLALLKALARRFPACRYLEIGTLRGESLRNVATVAAECVSLSLSNDDMAARGWSPGYLENNGLFLDGLPNLTRIGQDSQTFDFSSLGTFDMMFVDGDHTYRGVKNDTENVFRLLKDKRSIIVWHDYGAEYDTPAWSVMAGILDGCPSAERKHLYHVSNTLCAIYIRDQFVTHFAEHPVVPDKVFSVRITSRAR